MLKPIIGDLIKKGQAKGKIIVLDTMKKFMDPMSKKIASEFGETIRAFVSHGGSTIMLAHVNKHRDDGGRLIYAGTTDVVDDSDCAYTLDVISEEKQTKVVSFDNFKCRGNVAQSASFQYTKKENYIDILHSVEEIDENQKEGLLNKKSVNELLIENEQAINAITAHLNDHHQLKTSLVKCVQKQLGISRKNALSVLDEHTGNSYSKGHRWKIEKGANNAHYYYLLTHDENE
jgi:hypothetical protein